MAAVLSRAVHLSLCLVSGLLLGISALPSYSTPTASSSTITWRAISAESTAGSTTGSTAKLLREQLRNPAEVLTVLLLIGGDIVQKASAQLSCGDRGPFIPTPVAFSFGWVAYAFGALMSAFGDGLLMPAPDFTSFVATVNGQFKPNESWVMSRLIRDLELENIRLQLNAQTGQEELKLGGLRIVFYQTNGDSNTPHRDYVWYSWMICIPLQFGIAAIPLHHDNWSILTITALGTLLAVVTGSLKQWRREKYSGRPNAPGTYILTRGNGHGHAFVIRISAGNNWINLDDFAAAKVPGNHATRAATAILSVFWIFLLIMVGGMQQDTWFLLVVGLIGMLQNVLVAGLKRSSAAHGLPLRLDEGVRATNVGEGNGEAYVDEKHVLPALKRADKLSAGVGRALIPLFFPIGLQPEQEWWKEGEATPNTEVKAHNTVQQGQSDSVVSSSRATNSADTSGGIGTTTESHASTSRSP